MAKGDFVSLFDSQRYDTWIRFIRIQVWSNQSCISKGKTLRLLKMYLLVSKGMKFKLKN